MSVTENRLAELGIALPDANDAVANYVCVQRVGNMLYFSGCGPMSGRTPLYQGKLGSELTVEEGYNAARAAMLALLGQLKQELGDLDRVKRFVKTACLRCLRPGLHTATSRSQRRIRPVGGSIRRAWQACPQCNWRERPAF